MWEAQRRERQHYEDAHRRQQWEEAHRTCEEWDHFGEARHQRDNGGVMDDGQEIKEM